METTRPRHATQTDEEHVLDLVDGAVAKTEADIRRDLQAAVLSVREGTMGSLDMIQEVRTEAAHAALKTEQSVMRLHARLDQIGDQMQKLVEGQSALASQYVEAATRSAEFDDAVEFWAHFKSRYYMTVTWGKRTFGLVAVALIAFSIETILTGQVHIG